MGADKMYQKGNVVAGVTYNSNYARPIAEFLNVAGEMSANELAAALGISPSNLSHTMAHLKGLVKSQRKNSRLVYSLISPLDDDVKKEENGQLLNFIKILIRSNLTQSSNVNAQFILENFDEIIDALGVQQTILLMYFLEIIEVDPEELQMLLNRLNTSIEGLAKNILGEYYELLRMTREKMVIDKVHQKLEKVNKSVKC